MSSNEVDDHDEGNQSIDPIYFPPLAPNEAKINSKNNTKNTTNNNKSTGDDSNSLLLLHQACSLAVETKRPLHLTTSFLKLEETIVLRRQETLTIVGDYNIFNNNVDQDDHAEATKSVIIEGDSLHSLFILNNFSRLQLRHIHLKHTMEPTSSSGDGIGDHRQVGAAINLRKKSSLSMQHGSIHSTCGFCLWVVQKSKVHLQECKLHATLRSPLVCFGQPTVCLKACQIVDAGVHGLCARGEVQVLLEECTIRDSASRAIYAYAQASVTLIFTHISGTLRQDKAAIEVSAAAGGSTTEKEGEQNNVPTKPGKKKGKSGHVKIPPKSTLIMKDCKVSENAGIGVLIRGDVDCELVNMEWRNNAKGDFVETKALQNNDEKDDNEQEQNTPDEAHTSFVAETATTTKNISTTIFGLKRDPSGASSFRQGDWWCPKCYEDWYYSSQLLTMSNPVVIMAGKVECPTCGFNKDNHTIDNEHTSQQQQPQHQPQQQPQYGLTVSEIAGLNRGQGIPIRRSLIAKEFCTENKHQWLFDGGDDKGWIPYDETSNYLLEEAFQFLTRGKPIVIVYDSNITAPTTIKAAAETTVEAPQDQTLPNDDDDDENDNYDFNDKDTDATRPKTGSLVTLDNGKYQVDLSKMEQTNVESQMLRFVKRVPQQ
ncbi:MAG: hypothetical protein SGBAC_012643 [Bacillariaceae sp.]